MIDTFQSILRTNYISISEAKQLNKSGELAMDMTEYMLEFNTYKLFVSDKRVISELRDIETCV